MNYESRFVSYTLAQVCYDMGMLCVWRIKTKNNHNHIQKIALPAPRIALYL